MQVLYKHYPVPKIIYSAQEQINSISDLYFLSRFSITYNKHAFPLKISPKVCNSHYAKHTSTRSLGYMKISDVSGWEAVPVHQKSLFSKQ